MNTNDFKLGGAPLRASNPQPSLEKAVKILNGLPYKEVITHAELAEKIGLSYNHVRSAFSRNPRLSGYRTAVKIGKISNVVVWGSKRTISELERRLNA